MNKPVPGSPGNVPSNEKKDPKTHALHIQSFNSVMFHLVIHAMCLYTLNLCWPDAPKWISYIIGAGAWVCLIGGIIICLGYFIACIEGNVHVFEPKKKD